MITIIHGDDTANSRKYFIQLRQETLNSVSFEAENLSLTQLMQSVEGGGLFSDEKKIFIENFFSKKKTGKEADEILSYLKSASKVEVFFWEEKEVSKKNLNYFSGAVVKTFKLPKTLFLFLDSIKPNNKQLLINLFHETLKNVEPELIFYMLFRQFRFLLALNNETSNEEIDEIKKMASWQKSKLIKQTGFFSFEELKKIYQALYKIDLEQKTGKSATSIIQSLDFFLLEI